MMVLSGVGDSLGGSTDLDGGQSGAARLVDREDQNHFSTAAGKAFEIRNLWETRCPIVSKEPFGPCPKTKCSLAVAPGRKIAPSMAPRF